MIQRRRGEPARGIVPQVSRVTPGVISINRASDQAIARGAEIEIIHTDRMETNTNQAWHPIKNRTEPDAMQVVMRRIWIALPGVGVPEQCGKLFATLGG